MRYSRMFFALAILLSCCAMAPSALAQEPAPGFTLNGKVPGLPEGPLDLYLGTYLGGPGEEIASTTVDKEGAFTFTGRLEQPGPLLLVRGNAVHAVLYLENSVATFQATYSPLGWRDFQVTGSRMHEDFEAFQKQTGKIAHTNYAEMNRQKILFIEGHPDSYYSLLLMMDMGFNRSVPVGTIEKLYSGLAAPIRSSKPGGEMATVLGQLKNRSE